jgi:hypothetical protein
MISFLLTAMTPMTVRILTVMSLRKMIDWYSLLQAIHS